ncbi:LOW QUALITY PROTEIN: ADP-ribosylation factor-like protein 10 [Phaethornis superciliosus]
MPGTDRQSRPRRGKIRRGLRGSALIALRSREKRRLRRARWEIQAHVLVFVVGSVDGSRRTALQELHRLQDKSDALSAAELQELTLHTLRGQQTFLLPSSATWDSLATTTSVLHVKNLLVIAVSAMSLCGGQTGSQFLFLVCGMMEVAGS